MSEEREALLPCPFCGNVELDGPHLTEYIGDNYDPQWWIECGKCPSGMQLDGRTKEALIYAWNTRAQSSQAEHVKELEAVLRPFALLLQDHNNIDCRKRPHPDTKPIFGINDVTITLGDLRKAVKALNQKGGE
jgi:hypothetical protein